MGTYALIKKGLVINTILWDGPEASPMDFGKGISFEELPDGDGNNPSIGWSYDGTVFSPPPLTEEEVAAEKQQRISNNIAMKANLIAQATIEIAPLQDAVDLEVATDVESASLKKWKQYRVAVNRIDANTAEDVIWPEQPS